MWCALAPSKSSLAIEQDPEISLMELFSVSASNVLNTDTFCVFFTLHLSNATATQSKSSLRIFRLTHFVSFRTYSKKVLKQFQSWFNWRRMTTLFSEKKGWMPYLTHSSYICIVAFLRGEVKMFLLLSVLCEHWVNYWLTSSSCFLNIRAEVCVARTLMRYHFCIHSTPKRYNLPSTMKRLGLLLVFLTVLSCLGRTIAMEVLQKLWTHSPPWLRFWNLYCPKTYARHRILSSWLSPMLLHLDILNEHSKRSV